MAKAKETKAQAALRAESLAELRKLCPPGAEILVIIEATSKTNLTWYARIYVIHDGDLRPITAHVARILRWPRRDKNGWHCMVGGGVGTSRDFEIAHNLSYYLHGSHSDENPYTGPANMRPGYTLKSCFI